MTFFSKIVGVTFRPIKAFINLQEGQELQLVPEPSNEFDEYAVAVYRTDTNEKLGYLGASHGFARQVFDSMKKNLFFTTTIASLSGDWVPVAKEGFCFYTPSGNHWGINISIKKREVI